jgi:hypothetical protein
MIDAAYLTALRLIVEHLRGSRAVWALTGSLGWALQGVPVEPHDIDLQTDATGAYEIERRLTACGERSESTYVLRPVAFSAAERIRSHLGALVIDGVPVEVMGAVQKRLPDGTWEPPVEVARYRRWIEVEGLRVPVLSLSYEYGAHLTLGRTDRAELLRPWLDQDKTGT